MSAIRVLLSLCLSAMLTACGGAALEAVGLRKAPELPESQQPPRKVPLRLHAAGKLNADSRGQPLALAVRLYKLRQKAAFEQMPYAAFLNPQLERESLGADLIEVREIMLVPGQRYEVTEKVAREAGHLGIVALFHRPAEGRWRAAFNTQEAERSGVTVGLHACAMTVGGAAAMLGSARCQ
ncbi:type VI secretion system lipoprotein TssJ [Massilia sp. ST3]|uniref:type VI secretion system lipoprotein TssJ n=1 Tax=Massilia sp. ST3 TaxID=2824903 RepID=UPI001B83954A|nr:type VI secretion system lipoprotein TssJ [Massilia sp. ST3]MBQ5949664.1 type VI secretion system lipoprotein TssJ [Massilia sp. ST3]